MSNSSVSPQERFLSQSDMEVLMETLSDSMKLSKKVNSEELLALWNSIALMEKSIVKHTPSTHGIDAELEEQRKKLAESEAALRDVKQSYSDAFFRYRRTADAATKIFGLDLAKTQELSNTYLEDYEDYLKRLEENVVTKKRQLQSLTS